uniref:Myb/SANT-like domain-containing protein n=1 Tax=Spongospora subterranea TaxID=70186 RepID=A0A0H5R7W8_9EUKA|eukprot:CRZ04379.1 hypothetical protein [Spongospora subterranea]
MAKKDNTRAVWDEAKDTFLIELLQTQSDIGKRADSGWKKEAWVAVSLQFAALYPGFEKSQLKHRVDSLKKDFKLFKTIKENSGFGWDPEIETPTAPDEVWDRLIESNKALKKFRGKPFPLFDRLSCLFDGAIATGEFTRALQEFEDPEPSQSESQSLQSNASPGVKKRKRVSATGGSPPPCSDNTPRRNRSAGHMLAESMRLFVEYNMNQKQQPALPAVALGPELAVERAVTILTQEYKASLSLPEITTMIDILSMPFKATIFCSLKDATIRDSWVQQQLSKNM